MLKEKPLQPSEMLAHSPEKSREQAAWAILWSAFLIFIFISSSVLGGTAWYRNKALISMPAHLDLLTRGTAAIQRQGHNEWIDASQGANLNEEDSIRTSSSAISALTLNDDTHLKLYPDSQLTLHKLEYSRYSHNRAINTLTLLQGEARISVASSHFDQTLTLVSLAPGVGSLEAVVELKGGDYTLRIATNGTFAVLTHSGAATISTPDFHHPLAIVKTGQRATISFSGVKHQSKAELSDIAENFVKDGNFTHITSSLADQQWGQWYIKGIVPENPLKGSAYVLPHGFFDKVTPSVRFSRQSGDGKHYEVQLHQEINRYVLDYQHLHLRAWVKVDYQSLSGGGEVDSEYPLLLRIRYIDYTGGEQAPIIGFYYQNEAQYDVPHGKQVVQGQWQLYEGDFAFQSNQESNPVFIKSIEVAAVGHDFTSEVAQVQLVAE